MHKFATIMLAFNGIGVAVSCVLATYHDPGFWLVAYSMSGFGVLFFLLALISWRQHLQRKRMMREQRWPR